VSDDELTLVDIFRELIKNREGWAIRKGKIFSPYPEMFYLGGRWFTILENHIEVGWGTGIKWYAPNPRFLQQMEALFQCVEQQHKEAYDETKYTPTAAYGHLER
jgi:hypothetical protein